MKSNTKRKDIVFITRRWGKFLCLVIIPCFVLLIFLFRKELVTLGTYFPACPSRTYFNIYCPGCGNTRSVQSLLNGDILGSLKYNPFPAVGIILAGLAYLELVTAAFARHRRIIPRGRSYWVVFAICAVIYYFIRNFISLM